MFVIVMQPPMLPPGEYRYACKDVPHVRQVHAALEKLGVEIIDVEHNEQSLTLEQWKKVLGE